MADDDMFIEEERIKKMIAAGIYDEDMANKMKTIKNKDLKDNTMIRPASERPIERQQRPEREPPFPHYNSRGRGRGFGRGQMFMPGRGRGREQQSFNNRIAAPMRNKFMIEGSVTANKWRDPAMEEEMEEESRFNKRPRSTTGDGFRDGFREGNRDKFQRNETERNRNMDYINDRTAGNSSNDTDLRPKSDTDSRIRDTDLRTASNPLNIHKTAPNLPKITPKTTDSDFRRGDGNGDTGGGFRGGRDLSKVKSLVDQKFFGSNSSERNAPNVQKNAFIDDVDAFIEMASSKLRDPLENNGSRGRGQGDDYKPNFFKPEDPLGLKQEDDPIRYRQDDPIGLRHSDHSFDRRSPEDDFDSGPDIIEVPKKDDPIEILKETVEDLAKSNLYCQYCDCYLSSLIEVNSHIGTPNHQKNMAKKVMEENNMSAGNQSKPNETQPINRPMSQTIVERVPSGMATIVQMIEQRKQITLKSLIEMESYEISCDSEAALAKELAKLLTNELLNYKMNLMPETVKEALKHQGIGLLNSISN